MFDLVITVLFLAIPLIISGVFHMLVVSRNWFSFLAIPINKEMFGQNKTWRGIIVMMAATIPGVYLAILLEPALSASLLVDISTINPILLGILLGIGYVIPELPNSYVKRRMNIVPGERSEKHAVLFSFIDQADSAIGCAFVYWVLFFPPIPVIIAMVLLGPFVHVVANLMLFSAGLRKQPF